MSQVCKVCHNDEYRKLNPTAGASEHEHSSESEHSSDSEHTSESDNHHRGERDVRGHHHRHQQRENNDHYHTQTDFDIPEYDETKKVVMPTGKSFFIKTLVTPKWKCGLKTRLITIRNNGRMGRREFEIVSHEMGNTMVDLPNDLNYSGYYIVKIQKIVQGCAWRRYLNRQRDIALENSEVNEKMLFHGSPHVGPIMSSGFDERHSYAGGKLGAGIYFTPQSSVANQFVFGFFGGDGCPKHKDKNCFVCNRHMLLCRVTLGTVKEFSSSSLGQMSHPPIGYHSVAGVPGEGSFEYPEYVIYRGEQAYPEYLITYRIVE